MGFKRCSNCIHGNACGTRVWTGPLYNFDETALAIIRVEPEAVEAVGTVVRRECKGRIGEMCLSDFDTCVGTQFERRRI